MELFLLLSEFNTISCKHKKYSGNPLPPLPAIKDSLILNLEQANGDDIMPLFLVLNNGYELNDVLKKNIKKELRTKCSPRHVPNRMLAIEDIPYTLSGKKMEVPIKKILMGRTSPENINWDAIRNPAAMDIFVKLKL